jgi:hypothetical protein
LSDNNSNLENTSKYITVLLSCYSLGGAKNRVHTEEIGYKCYLLNRNKFSWQLEKYKKFPDTAKIRKSLDSAKKKGWLIGSYTDDLLKDGWKLSVKGIEEVEKYKYLLKLKKNKTQLTSIDKKFLKNFTKNKYYKNYLKNKDIQINTFELADILGSAPGNANHIRSKFYDYKSLSIISQNENLISFMGEIEKKFPDILNERLLQKQNMASNKKIGNIL